MTNGVIRILGARDVGALLSGREQAIIQTVRAAYEAHAAGESSLPHSTFLRFPNDQRNRIIAIAGMKWVASFPANIERGIERASAVVVVNSTTTGQPEAILEGSIINAKRTAASAALAAQQLHRAEAARSVGLIGCGVINREIARFLLAVFPMIERFIVFDIDPQRARQFADTCRGLRADLEVDTASAIAGVFSSTTLISFATTASTPYIGDLSACAAGSTILHISLRDLTPELILTCDNIVDDVDHVCRMQTSVHLAEQLVQHRNFIRCTLADITSGAAPARPTPDRIAVFSPFGLGVLDLAVSKYVLERAAENEQGVIISGFLPE
jgi:ornithine cyclodeaminase